MQLFNREDHICKAYDESEYKDYQKRAECYCGMREIANQRVKIKEYKYYHGVSRGI